MRPAKLAINSPISQKVVRVGPKSTSGRPLSAGASASTEREGIFVCRIAVVEVIGIPGWALELATGARRITPRFPHGPRVDGALPYPGMKTLFGSTWNISRRTKNEPDCKENRDDRDDHLVHGKTSLILGLSLSPDADVALLNHELGDIHFDPSARETRSLFQRPRQRRCLARPKSAKGRRLSRRCSHIR